MTAATGPVTVRRDNPLCGDEIELTISVAGGVIDMASDRTRACSLTRSSARLLARLVPGMTAAQARALAQRVDRAMKGTDALPDGFDEVAGVVLMPSRRRCVLLPWAALAEALDRAP